MIKSKDLDAVGDDLEDVQTGSAHDAMFFDPGRHAEALALLTSAHLTRESPSAAFPFADRRCRILKPSARDLLLRAEASRLAGFADHAKSDLADALRIDPTDTLINFGALSWGAADSRVGAARRLVADDNASLEVLALAIEALWAEGERAVARFSWSGRFLTGWITWNSRQPLEIQAIGPTHAARFALDRDPAHGLSGDEASAARVALLDDEGNLRALELMLDGEIVTTVATPPRNVVWDAPATRRSSETSLAPLTVIVPVYEDFEATRACLTSLIGQAGQRRIIVVDDASPNAELVEYLDQAADHGDLELIRNVINVGFAGAVNQSLTLVNSGDVLLLNADAWLPPGAIDRLAAIANSTPEIGTVTPFSNNGEYTSYPVPNDANPMPSHEQIVKLDASARRANGDGAVDLPNGIGFCLYITRACLDAVGPLSQAYLRGYYEDVEFCLKAREHGFRNVCATGVFVGHVGSLSFGEAKRALVVRNLAVLELRFPGYRMRSAAFLAADPLRSARAAIDEVSPPDGEAILLVSGQGKSKRLAELRSRTIVATTVGAVVLHGAVDRAGRRIDIRREGEGAPQSLTFRLDGSEELARMEAYFRAVTIRRLEIVDASAIPEDVLRLLVGVSGRVEMICGDLEGFGRLAAPHVGVCRAMEVSDVCEACGDAFPSKEGDPTEATQSRDRLNLALTQTTAIRPLDRMGEAFSRRVFKAKALALEAEAAPAAAELAALAAIPVLGALVPAPSTAIDRLVLRLARLFERLRVSTKIVVIGRCVDDLALMGAGNTFVTGPAEPDEYERLATQYGFGPLWLPDRTAFFGLLDRLATVRGAPIAYFDWSFGFMGRRPGDLSLDPRACDEKAAEAIAFWVGSLYREEAA